MIRDVAARLRAELEKPDPRPSRPDLAAASEALTAVDTSLQSQLIERTRDLAALQEQYDQLLADFLRLVEDRPADTAHRAPAKPAP